MSGQRPRKRPDFVSPKEKAKSEVVAQFVRIARKARLNYDDFLYVAQQTRRKLGLRRTKKERQLPQLLPETELRRFFQVIQECGDGPKAGATRCRLPRRSREFHLSNDRIERLFQLFRKGKRV